MFIENKIRKGYGRAKIPKHMKCTLARALRAEELMYFIEEVVRRARRYEQRSVLQTDDPYGIEMQMGVTVEDLSGSRSIVLRALRGRAWVNIEHAVRRARRYEQRSVLQTDDPYGIEIHVGAIDR